MTRDHLIAVGQRLFHDGAELILCFLELPVFSHAKI